MHWRLTVHGPHGEAIGSREITHLADFAAADRDRLDVAATGQQSGRNGATAFVQRHGVPWPTGIEAAAHELELFGLQLRLPWAFADLRRFAAAAATATSQDGESLLQFAFTRRPARSSQGPSPIAEPLDRFELLVPAAGGLPRELRYLLAASNAPRRVLLENWQPVAATGVQVPYRRRYVDDAGRPTTTLEIERLVLGAAATARDFQLH